MRASRTTNRLNAFAVIMANSAIYSVFATVITSYWLRVFRLIGFACNVLGLLILGAVA
jgi:hypothetical protein